SGPAYVDLSQNSSTVSFAIGAPATWCQPIIVLPRAETTACARATTFAYASWVIVVASSPPMWRYGPGVRAASPPRTSVRNRSVSGSSTQSALNPTLMPVYGGGALPSQLSSGYEARAALTWPGRSISGTTVTNRAAAYSTIFR